MKKKHGSLSVVLAAFLANLFIAMVKFAVAALTRSSAMLAEAIHSGADTMNQVLLFVGMRKAARKADELHPFGFSGEGYFWSFIVAISDTAAMTGTVGWHTDITCTSGPRCRMKRIA